MAGTQTGEYYDSGGDLLPHKNPFLYQSGTIDHVYRKGRMTADEEEMFHRWEEDMDREIGTEAEAETDDGLAEGDIKGLRTHWRPEENHLLGDDERARKLQAVEAMAQAGAIVMYKELKDKERVAARIAEEAGEEPPAPEAPPIPLFGGIDLVKFAAAKEMPGEGDVISFEAWIRRKERKMVKGQTVAQLGDTMLANGVLKVRPVAARSGPVVFGMPVESADPQERQHTSIFDRRSPNGIWLSGVTAENEDRDSAEGFLLVDDEQTAGHVFAGQPVFPGVKQVGAFEDLMRFLRRDEELDLVALRDVAFTRVVKPTERLDLEVKVTRVKAPEGKVYRVAGIAVVAGVEACRATLDFLPIAA